MIVKQRVLISLFLISLPCQVLCENEWYKNPKNISLIVTTLTAVASASLPIYMTYKTAQQERQELAQHNLTRFKVVTDCIQYANAQQANQLKVRATKNHAVMDFQQRYDNAKPENDKQYYETLLSQSKCELILYNKQMSDTTQLLQGVIAQVNRDQLNMAIADIKDYLQKNPDIDEDKKQFYLQQIAEREQALLDSYRMTPVTGVV